MVHGSEGEEGNRRRTYDTYIGMYMNRLTSSDTFRRSSSPGVHTIYKQYTSESTTFILPGGSTMQGAAPVTVHSWPSASMVPAQQSALVSPGIFPHVEPPQTPQASTQQIKSSFSTPGNPLLQKVSFEATVVEQERGEGRQKNTKPECVKSGEVHTSKHVLLKRAMQKQGRGTIGTQARQTI